MSDRSFRVLLWSLAFVGLFADQVSKYGVFSWLQDIESHSYAVFQTDPETRYLQTVPFEPDIERRMAQRGFFFEVVFEQSRDASGNPVPHVNHGALFGFLREHR